MQSRALRAFQEHATWLLVGAFLLSGSVGCAGQSAQKGGGTSETRATFDVSPGMVLERACTPSGPELCFNATDDNCNGIIDEGCGLSTGLIQFSVAWAEPKADVDLQVIDPNGVLIEVGRVAASGLVKERDCPGPNNLCQGQNIENVYLADGEPLRGKYRVRVRLEKLQGENPPIKVRLGARVGPKTYALELNLEKQEEERELVMGL